MRSRPIARIAIALLALALALVAADRALAKWGTVPTLIFRLEPVLLHELVPGAKRVVKLDASVGGGSNVVAIDSAGFRGPEIAREKRGPRLVVYGDSLVLGENVDFERTFGHALQTALAASTALAIEVVNAGVTGYGPDQACLKLERELPELAPEGVIFVLCAHNDFGDLVRDKLFAIGAKGALELQEHSFHPALVQEFEAKERASHRPPLVRWVQALFEKRASPVGDPSGAAQANRPYMQWYLAAAADEYSEYVVEGDRRVRTLFEDYYDADVAIDPNLASARFKMALMTGVLRRVRASCDYRGVPLLVLVVPSAVDLSQRFDIRVDPSVYPTYMRSRLTDMLVSILTGEGISYVDLFPLFDRADPDSLFVGHTDFHWNAKGQELAASIVATQIDGLGWLRPRAPPK